MPAERIEAEGLQVDPWWYGLFIPIIFGALQLNRQDRGGNEWAHSISQTAAVAFTIVLISLAASMPRHCCKILQICIFSLILGWALLLVDFVPKKLTWMPYLSCIRPLFHLLLPDPFQLRVLQFSQAVWDPAIKRLVRLVDLFPPQIVKFLQTVWNYLFSSQSQANFKSEAARAEVTGAHASSSTRYCTKIMNAFIKGCCSKRHIRYI